jgi:hypothetical protein
MGEMSIEMLSPERVAELEDALEPIFDQACQGNEIAAMEMTGKDIVQLGKEGMAAILVGFHRGKATCVIAFQFNITNGRKGADLIAMGGSKLLRFKAAYWPAIIEWLRVNGIEFLDAYTPNSRAELYIKKFGFDKSCAYVRMSLQ